MIPRAVYIETVFSSRERIESHGLEIYTGLSTSSMVENYRIIFYGLLVQEEGFPNVYLLSPSEYIVFKKPRVEFCRWHSGSLNIEDDPLKREYCIEKKYTALGYCRLHSDSIRALYSYCFESRSLDGLTGCEQLDRLLKGSVEFLVYMLAYSSDGFKVGSTRKWRLIRRLAEQPHIVASTLYVSSSASEARRIEAKAGSLDWLTEVPHRDIRRTLSTPIKAVLNKFIKLRERTLRILGLNETDTSIVRVEPASNLEVFQRAKNVDLYELIDKKLEIYDYGYGYLLLSNVSSNEYFILKFPDVMNKDCLRTVR